MKKIFFNIFISAIIALSLPINAQVATGYEVATWYKFRTSALTYTFDDNTPNQLTVALPLFNKYNYKTTLFIITSRISSWSGYITAATNGHEISSHTVHHLKLGDLTLDNQDLELKNSQITIKDKIKSSTCRSIAYPFCGTGDMTTIQKYYFAGRVCNNAIMPSTPTDFYRINAIITGSLASVQTAQQFNTKADLAKAAKGWCVFLTHAIDSETGYSPTQSTELASHLEYVNANSSDFWVATFENVVKYIKERNALSISEVPASSNSYKVSITDDLPDSVYNVPVTIKRLLPATWLTAKVYLNNEQIESSISTVGNNKYIVFDVIPDKGDLMLVNSNETKIASINDDNIKIEPNPFLNEIYISAPGFFKYSIYSLNGQLSAIGNDFDKIKIGDDLMSGIYILKVFIDNQIYSKKIIKI